MKSRKTDKVLSQNWIGFPTYLRIQNEKGNYALHNVERKINKAFSIFIDLATGIIKCRLVKACKWNINKIFGMGYRICRKAHLRICVK
jgi:hypothetical protein